MGGLNGDMDRPPSNMALQRTRRPRLRSGRSLRSLGSPLNARPLDAGRISMAQVVLAAVLLMGMSRGPGIVWTKPGDLRVVVVDRDSVPIPGVTVTLSPALQKPL